MTEPESAYLQSITETIIADEMNAQRHRGTTGPWCKMCGHTDVELAACRCDFPSEFGCVKLGQLCASCRKAHEDVGAFLLQMFREKRVAVRRVDARRARWFRFLRAALETVGEKNPDSRAKALRSAITSHADPWADEPDDFREGVLRAFRVSKFLAFRELAAAIEVEDNNFMVEKLVESGIFNA